MILPITFIHLQITRIPLILTPNDLEHKVCTHTQTDCVSCSSPSLHETLWIIFHLIGLHIIFPRLIEMIHFIFIYKSQRLIISVPVSAEERLHRSVWTLTEVNRLPSHSSQFDLTVLDSSMKPTEQVGRASSLLHRHGRDCLKGADNDLSRWTRAARRPDGAL